MFTKLLRQHESGKSLAELSAIW